MDYTNSFVGSRVCDWSKKNAALTKEVLFFSRDNRFLIRQELVVRIIITKLRRSGGMEENPTLAAPLTVRPKSENNRTFCLMMMMRTMMRRSCGNYFSDWTRLRVLTLQEMDTKVKNSSFLTRHLSLSLFLFLADILYGQEKSKHYGKIFSPGEMEFLMCRVVERSIAWVVEERENERKGERNLHCHAKKFSEKDANYSRKKLECETLAKSGLMCQQSRIVVACIFLFTTILPKWSHEICRAIYSKNNFWDMDDGTIKKKIGTSLNCKAANA